MIINVRIFTRKFDTGWLLKSAIRIQFCHFPILEILLGKILKPILDLVSEKFYIFHPYYETNIHIKMHQTIESRFLVFFSFSYLVRMIRVSLMPKLEYV